MQSSDKDKRISEVDTCITKFADFFRDKYNKVLVFNSESAKSITDAYEMMLDRSIRQYLKPGNKASKFKVASGLELAAIYKQPIFHIDPKVARELNALFAASLATNILFGILYDNLEFKTSVPENNSEILNLTFDHLTWLKYIDTHELWDLPVFANSLYWQSFAIIYSMSYSAPLTPSL